MAKEKLNTLQKIKSTISWPIRRFSRFGRRGKIVILIILALLAYWRINAYRNSGIEVQVKKARRDKLVETVDASGEITAVNSANLVFETAGEVTQVNFKEGDSVSKGDIIAKLDTTNLYNNYKIAEATLRAAEAALASTYDSLQGHGDDETFAQISTRTTAETTKDKAYWAFATASKNLQGAYIKAPFDGILTKVPENIVPGADIGAPSAGTFQVVDPKTVYFETDVSEVDINKLEGNEKAQIEIDAFGEDTFTGEILGTNFASTTTSTGGTAYTVRISLPENQDMEFKLGMNGDVEIIISEKENVLLAPITAIVDDNSNSYAWVVEGKTAKRKTVETGRSSINEIEIVSGIAEGENIILRPPSKIEEGARVKVTE